MRPLLVVVGHEFAEHRPEMLLVQDDHSLDDGVRPRRSNRRGDGVDTDPSGSLAEVTSVHRIPITEQVARLLAPGRRLDQLAPDPGGGRSAVTFTWTSSRR